jgi:biotin operon repressor
MFWAQKEDRSKGFEADMRLISRWINHLHETDKTHHSKHNEIISYLHQMHQFVQTLKQENITLKREITDLKQNSISRDEALSLINCKEVEIDTRHLEQQIIEKLKGQLPKSTERIVEKIIEIPQKTAQIDQKSLKIETSTQKTVQPELTYSEKLVLNVLFSAESPLSYEAIGSRLNKKSGTIKVYMNDLKKKGIDLEDLNGPGNIKLYALTNKEKVKKLYNIQM